MRRLWARVGVTFEVTEEEYQKLLSESKADGRYDDVDIYADKEYLIKHNAEIDGDSYIPATIFEEEDA